ncbi:hypothetical protein E4T47_04397 [Aureobasidium subglaciale]|nr:hypothetical protein E4T47_04397 [Aureobasidium subglaciale]
MQSIDSHSYETVIESTAAREILSKFIINIDIDRAYLAALCEKYGDTILSRWKKKTQNRREALLLKADATIEKEAWFRLRTESDEVPWQQERRLRRTWLLPYMSTAILKANPSVLLGLIHNQQWAPFDNDLIRHGWVGCQLGREYGGR